MELNASEELRRTVKKIMSNSALETKQCYVIGCRNATIKAHSISNKRLLLKLSDNGMVMHKSKIANTIGELAETGRGAATVFRGLCGEHDKMFLPIDNTDYIVGNSEQEYLFALRAAAHEFSVKSAVQNAVEAVAYEHKLAHPDNMPDLEKFILAHSIGLKDQSATRSIFIDTAKKNKHNVIETVTIAVNEELPMAVNSSFDIELDDQGNLINDHSETEDAFKKRMKPCFLNIFPQNGKTYCLISYWRKDRTTYAFIEKLNSMSELDKKVLISNLIAVYTENFVANPTFWKSLTLQRQDQYLAVFNSTFTPFHASLVLDDSFNLFPSAQPFYNLTVSNFLSS